MDVYVHLSCSSSVSPPHIWYSFISNKYRFSPQILPILHKPHMRHREIVEVLYA